MNEDNTEMLKVLNRGVLIEELWQTAVEAASPAELGPSFGRFLRAWNTLAVERMETEGRLTPGDLAIAESNLRRFIQLMKTEASFWVTQAAWIGSPFTRLTRKSNAVRY